MVVLKYQVPFTPGTSQHFQTFVGYKILKVGLQNGIVTLWVAVDYSNYSKGIARPGIYITGTGWDNDSLSVNSPFLDTLFFEDGTVWHVFVV